MNAKISKLKQKITGLTAEVNSHWTHLVEDNLNFNKKELRKKALKKVTPELVKSYFDSICFDKTRQLVIKICSRKHTRNDESKRLNDIFYENETIFPRKLLFEKIEITQIKKMQLEHKLYSRK